jgi:predicted RNA binding protein YcfA (HicA-like mRNA interferase family)
VICTTAKEAERMIKKDGWRFFDSDGSHYHYKHPIKTGKVTIPHHSGKELKTKTLKSIKEQAGLK